MFSFTFGFLVLDRTERSCISQLVYYLELSNTWYKGIKTVKYYAFPTVFGDLIEIFSPLKLTSLEFFTLGFVLLANES